MDTVWDWLTIFAFAGLVTLMLQRSAEEKPTDKLWQYGPAAIGCALCNYVGNEGHDLFAALILLAVAVYVFVVLKVRLPRT